MPPKKTNPQKDLENRRRYVDEQNKAIEQRRRAGEAAEAEKKMETEERVFEKLERIRTGGHRRVFSFPGNLYKGKK